MKVRISPGWLFGLVWAVVAAAHVVAQNTPPPPTTTASDAALAPKTDSPPRAVTATPIAPAGAAALSPGLNTPLAGSASEVQRLTQAGVDQPVILAYITNSTRIFKLNPDDIIHLQGAGVSPQVISAMIEHDQSLSAAAPPPANPTPLLAAPPAIPAAPSLAVGESQIVADETAWTGDDLDADDGYSVAEQPASAGPVRMPYPVKLNDPIVILRLPTFTVPCW
jgi:hypothetical protein